MRHLLKKSTLFVILVFLLALMVFPACSKGKSRPESGQIIQQDYHTGTQGLVIRFLPGSPPRNLYKGDPLSIVVEYSNKGAYDINNGHLYISGYDRNYITFQNDRYLSLKAIGKNEFNPLGEISNTVEFYDDAVSMPSFVDIYSPRFMVTACYKYKTEAFKEVCVDPDPYGVKPTRKVCTVHDVNFGTQGAPVAVNYATEAVAKNRVVFKVQVSNVGGGTVIDDRASIAECHKNLKRTDIDKVRIDAKLSNKQLKCEPEIIQLVGGTGYSLCSYEGNLGSEAYLTVLNIILSYGYSTSIEGKTDIYRIPGEEI
ncbi:MAG: hypothetical protein N3D84_02585 [Candidatus Woesearchaeota archaeon]|nr:hypothetical protein [Candidatus Woesearchaeota archaeon]